MAIQTNVQHCLVVHTIKGHSSAQEILSYLQDNSPKWGCRPSIWDITDLSHADISTTDIRLLASNILANPPRQEEYKTAIIAESNLSFGMARMLQSYLGDRYDDRLKVYRSLDSAFQWLCVDDSTQDAENTPSP